MLFQIRLLSSIQAHYNIAHFIFSPLSLGDSWNPQYRFSFYTLFNWMPSSWTLSNSMLSYSPPPPILDNTVETTKRCHIRYGSVIYLFPLFIAHLCQYSRRFTWNKLIIQTTWVTEQTMQECLITIFLKKQCKIKMLSDDVSYTLE